MTGALKLGVALIAVELSILLWQALYWMPQARAIFVDFGAHAALPTLTRVVIADAWMPVAGSLFVGATAWSLFGIRATPRRETAVAVLVFVGFVLLLFNAWALQVPFTQLADGMRGAA